MHAQRILAAGAEGGFGKQVVEELDEPTELLGEFTEEATQRRPACPALEVGDEPVGGAAHADVVVYVDGLAAQGAREEARDEERHVADLPEAVAALVRVAGTGGVGEHERERAVRRAPRGAGQGPWVREVLEESDEVETGFVGKLEVLAVAGLVDGLEEELAQVVGGDDWGTIGHGHPPQRVESHSLRPHTYRGLRAPVNDECFGTQSLGVLIGHGSAGASAVSTGIPGAIPAHSSREAGGDDEARALMTTIRQEDVIQSVADALQFISYYHPQDYIENLARAYEREASTAARDAMAQILVNSRLCAEGKRPICQDTGIVTVFVEVGMDVRWEATLPLEAMINEGVRRAYLHPDNKLRASILADPAGQRVNTKDNTPAVIHVSLVPGDTVSITVAAKGGGSENKSKFAMLNPADDIVDWVVRTVPGMGAGWCPPGMLGIGIGGTAEKAMVLAKRSLMDPIDMPELKARGPRNRLEELRIEIHDRVNALGIGAQGLGGLTTVLDVKILDYPTHAASKPVAMIPNCAATRHAHFELDGSGPATLPAPDLAAWPQIAWSAGESARRVDLDTVTAEEVASWQPGETLLLSGTLLTGRDAAHKRLVDLLERGEALPVDFRGRFIYYVGPVDAVRDEAVGPAGPTTATRMDRFTRPLLAATGLLGMIGKAERGPEAIEAIRDHRAVYLIAVGGAAYLVSKAIRAARVVAFPELGMEAIHEFDVRDMPVTVAVDARGESVHRTGPEQWRRRIVEIPVVLA